MLLANGLAELKDSTKATEKERQAQSVAINSGKGMWWKDIPTEVQEY